MSSSRRSTRSPRARSDILRPMKRILLAAAIVVASVCTTLFAQRKEPAFRTAWGDPDISGLFTTDDELGVPFERPAQFGDRQYVTDEEYKIGRASCRERG